MADLDPDLSAMVQHRTRYHRVRALLDAMGVRGADAAAFYATGDMLTEWLACMPPEMRKLLRFSTMLAIHRHMTGTNRIRGVLAYDPESIAEWKRMTAASVRPRLTATYYTRGQQEG